MRSFTEDTGLDRVELIASDMDCTLLADDKSMPEGMGRRIGALAEAGVTFAAASGRPLYTLEAMFPGSAGRMAFVSDNGATVAVGGRAVFRSLIPGEVLARLVKFTMADGRGCPVVCGTDRARALASARRHKAALDPYYSTAAYVDTPEELLCEANKFTVYFPGLDSVEACADAFAPEFGGLLSVTPAGPEWLDVMNPGVNKGTGITRLCEHLGVDLADAVAIGDTDNDAEMLEAAGHGYLVANAEERMWPHADFLAPSNNECGVAQVIDAVLAARRP